MVREEELGWILRVLSSSVRRSIIKGLANGKRGYSDLIGKDPLHKNSPGVFNFHLGKLVALGIIQKHDDFYELTWKGRLVSNYLHQIKEDYVKVVGEKSLKTDGIGWRPWEQVKCQLEWARQHATRDPLATLGMTIMYLDGMYEILSYPYGLELTVKRVMSNLKEVAEKEKEPGIFELACELSVIKRGDLVEYESSVEGLEESISLVESSPRWLELLPKRLSPEEARETPKSLRTWMKRSKKLAREGRMYDALYIARWTAFSVIGFYAEGIPERTGTWRDTFLDSLIEIGKVDPGIRNAYLKAFGLESYSINDSTELVKVLDKHLALSREIMAKHDIEDLTQTES